MVKNTPAMGWNTWNTFTNEISEELVLRSADIMVESGLKDAGYEYIVIDDCWSLHERDKGGRLQADPVKFPHGMKYVADYVHSKGLKFGMYSCAGAITCAGYPASYEHEFIDAKTFAEWGVDYLKYDYCYHSMGTPGHLLYKRMGIALANCGRNILYSACSWGVDDTRVWIKETGANSWRSTPDILDNWVSVKDIITYQIKYTEYNGLGCFNDLDMLIVGMNGGGNIGKTQGCTYDEYFTHFAFWCMYGSTLMLGNDIRSMSEETKKIVTNKDLIRINQDKKYCQPFFIWQKMEKNTKRSTDNDTYYENYPDSNVMIARFLDDGKIAIGVFNLSDSRLSDFNSYFLAESVGVPESSGKRLRLRDVVTNEITESGNGIVKLRNVEAHASAVYIAEVIDA